MCDHVPGLLTSTIPAMVRPRKTSSETSRSVLLDIGSTIHRFHRLHRFTKERSPLMNFAHRSSDANQSHIHSSPANLCSLWLILIVLAPPAEPAGDQDQTLQDSAKSTSLRTCAAFHPSAGSSSTRSKSFDRNELKRSPTSKAYSLRATASDSPLSELTALRPSRAGCYKSPPSNNEAGAPLH